MKRLACFFLIAGLMPVSEGLAQSDIHLATHWYNRANYNPASIARTDYLYIFSNISQQWLGVEGAPKVYNIQASEYFNNLHAAFGLSLVKDQIGATQAINPMATYAYRIAHGKDWALSMGISAGVFTRSIDGSLYEAEVAIDPSILYDVVKYIKPDANIGFEFQTAHFIYSISSTHLFSINKCDTLFLNTNHRYGSVVYKNTDSEFLSYYIGLQVINRYNLTTLEGNARIRFKHPTGLLSGPKDVFDIGLTYRSSRQLTLMFGLNFSTDLRVGYAYSQSFITGYYPNETHEIMLEYRIPNKAAYTR